MGKWIPSTYMADATPRVTSRTDFLEHERVTHGKKNISSDHAYIHEGYAFSYCHLFTIAAGAQAFLEILTPPAGTYIHFKPVSIQTDGPKILVQLVEAPTVGTPGTPVVPLNRRRVGTPSVATTVMRVGPASVSGGVVLDQFYVGGGTGSGANAVSGGSASADNEWVLAPDTLYHLEITNNGSASAGVNLMTFFYEEGDG